MAPTIATITLQIVALVITAFAVGADYFSRSACETCDWARMGDARLIYTTSVGALRVPR